MKRCMIQVMVLLTLLVTLGGCCWYGPCGPPPPPERRDFNHRSYRHYHDNDRQEREYRDHYRDDWRRRYDPGRDGYHEEYRR